MKRIIEILIVLSALIVGGQTVGATTIIAIWSESWIFIGADGLRRQVVAHTAGTNCKLEMGTAVVIGVAGATLLRDINGELAYDLQDIAQRVADTATSVSAAEARLNTETTPIAQGAPWALKRTNPQAYRSLLLPDVSDGREHGLFAAYLIAGREGNQFALARLVFGFSLPVGPLGAIDSVKLSVEETICPRDCGEQQILTVGLDNGLRAALPAVLKAHPTDAVAVIDGLLRAQASATPHDVGEPFAMARVMPKSVAWVPNHVCAAF
jgi:hypothetical protein